MLPNYYSILRINPDASPDEVRAAYRRMAKRHHPDAGGSSEEFYTVQEAYNILSDPARRRQYDAERKSHPKKAIMVEPLRPEPLTPPEPLRASRVQSLRPLEEFDRLFREFDEFFVRLEEEFLGPFWGRNE